MAFTGILVGAKAASATRRKLRSARSFRRFAGTVAQTSNMVSRQTDGGQRLCLQLNRSRHLNGIAVQASGDVLGRLPSRSTFLATGLSRMRYSDGRRTSMNSVASDASSGSINLSLRHLEDEFDKQVQAREQQLIQQHYLQSQDSVNKVSNMAAALAPFMLGCRILNATNDLAGSLGPSVDVIGQELQHHAVLQSQHIAHTNPASSLQALGMQAPSLLSAPDPSAFSAPSAASSNLQYTDSNRRSSMDLISPGSAAVAMLQGSNMLQNHHHLYPTGSFGGAGTAAIRPATSMQSPQLAPALSGGATPHTASAFDASAAGQALASMVQGQTTSSEGMDEGCLKAQYGRKLAEAHNLNAQTRGAGAVLMRVESMKRRAHKVIAMGLSKLWVAWHEGQGQPPLDRHTQDIVHPLHAAEIAQGECYLPSGGNISEGGSGGGVSRLPCSKELQLAAACMPYAEVCGMEAGHVLAGERAAAEAAKVSVYA